VVLLNLKVLARIALREAEFATVLNAIVDLFAADRRLLETRGSVIVRRLCVLLNARSIFAALAKVSPTPNAECAPHRPQ
jgi:vacuole morphology and inheritance protein 14